VVRGDAAHKGGHQLGAHALGAVLTAWCDACATRARACVWGGGRVWWLCDVRDDGVRGV
jgi:hypothetical protein